MTELDGLDLGGQNPLRLSHFPPPGDGGFCRRTARAVRRRDQMIHWTAREMVQVWQFFQWQVMVDHEEWQMVQMKNGRLPDFHDDP